MGCAASSGTPCCQIETADDEDDDSYPSLANSGPTSKLALQKIEEAVVLLKRAMRKMNIEDPLLTPPLWNSSRTATTALIISPKSTKGVSPAPGENGHVSSGLTPTPPTTKQRFQSAAKKGVALERRNNRHSLRFSASTNSTVTSTASLGATVSEGGWSFAGDQVLLIQSLQRRGASTAPGLQTAACFLLREAMEQHMGTKWLREHIGFREGDILLGNETLRLSSTSPKGLSPSPSAENVDNPDISPMTQPLSFGKKQSTSTQEVIAPLDERLLRQQLADIPSQIHPTSEADRTTAAETLGPSTSGANFSAPSPANSEGRHQFDSSTSSVGADTPIPQAAPLRPVSAGFAVGGVRNPFTLPSLRTTELVEDEQQSSAPPLRRTSTASAGVVLDARVAEAKKQPPLRMDTSTSSHNNERRKTLDTTGELLPHESEQATKMTERSPRQCTTASSPERADTVNAPLLTEQSTTARHHFDDDEPPQPFTTEDSQLLSPSLMQHETTNVVQVPSMSMEPVTQRNTDGGATRISSISESSTPEAESSRPFNTVVYATILENKTTAHHTTTIEKPNQSNQAPNPNNVPQSRRGRVSIIECDNKLGGSASLSQPDDRAVVSPPFDLDHARHSRLQTFSSFPQASGVVLATLDLRYRVAAICYEYGMFDLAEEQFSWIVDVSQTIMDDDLNASYNSVMGRVLLLWEAANLGIVRTVLTMAQHSRFAASTALREEKEERPTYWCHVSAVDHPFTREAREALEDAVKLCEKVLRLHERRYPVSKQMCRVMPPSSSGVLASRRLTVRLGLERLATMQKENADIRPTTATSMLVVGETSVLEAIRTRVRKSEGNSPKSPAADTPPQHSPHLAPRLQGLVFGSVAARALDLRYISMLEADAGVDEHALAAAAKESRQYAEREEEEHDGEVETSYQYAPSSYLSTTTHFRRTIDIAESAEARFTNNIPYDALSLLAVLHFTLGKKKESVSYARRAAGTATALFGLASAERWEAAMLLQELQEEKSRTMA